MPPPIIVTLYSEAIASTQQVVNNSCSLNVKQPAGILFGEALQMCWISLFFCGYEGFFQQTEAPAIVRPENHMLFTHGVDQKRQNARIETRTVDQEVLEKNF